MLIGVTGSGHVQHTRLPRSHRHPPSFFSFFFASHPPVGEANHIELPKVQILYLIGWMTWPPAEADRARWSTLRCERIKEGGDKGGREARTLRGRKVQRCHGIVALQKSYNPCCRSADEVRRRRVPDRSHPIDSQSWNLRTDCNLL